MHCKILILVLSKKILVSGNKLLKISKKLLVRIVSKIFLQSIFFLIRILTKNVFLSKNSR